MVWAVELSFTSYDMVSAPTRHRVDNSESLAADPIFRESLFNTIVYIAGSTALITVVGLGWRSRSTPPCPARATA